MALFDVYNIEDDDKSAIAMDMIVITHCDFNVVQNRILRYPL